MKTVLLILLCQVIGLSAEPGEMSVIEVPEAEMGKGVPKILTTYKENLAIFFNS